MRRMPSLRALLKRLGGIAVCRRLTSQWFPLSLAYFRIRKLHYPCPVRLRTGEVLTLREFTDLVIFWLVFVREHYPVKPTCRTIVDVGANVGIFTLYASRKAPAAEIFAVEPFPDTFERLNETIHVNHLEARVTPIRCALTSSSGVISMDSSEGVPSQYRSVLSEIPKMLNVRHKQTHQPSGNLAVPSVTLSVLLESLQRNRIDLLKMNIHGNEYDVLLPSADSVLAQFSRVLVQYHEVPEAVGLGKRDLCQRMQTAGFRLVEDDDTRRGAGRAIFAQIFPLAEPVAA